MYIEFEKVQEVIDRFYNQQKQLENLWENIRRIKREMEEQSGTEEIQKSLFFHMEELQKEMEALLQFRKVLQKVKESYEKAEQRIERKYEEVGRERSRLELGDYKPEISDVLFELADFRKQF